MLTLLSGADIKFLVKRLRKLLADITFLEAYERTNRFLNVTVTAADTNEPPRMLNYMTAPNVLVWSAVACSSAFPGLFPAQELLARDRDGRFVKCVTCLCTESFSIQSSPNSSCAVCAVLFLQHSSTGLNK
jgi:predicted acylesterase/phospholipase RssA